MELKAIGTIRTPYRETAPFRPPEDAEGEFVVIVDREYEPGLKDLGQFSHIIVLFWFDRSQRSNILVHPPHLGGRESGLFASRSPNRINKIGINVVRILRIEGNRVYTSPMDILDGSPLLDIKPYIPDLDCHPSATKGHAP